MGKRSYNYYLFLLPALIFLITFTYYPIFWSLWLSLHKWNLLNPKPKFNELFNFSILFKDEVFWLIMRNTLKFASISIFITMLFAIFFAILIDEQTRGKIFYIYSFFYPTLIPMAAAAMLWVYIYSPNLGPLNLLLARMGITKPGWLGASATSLWAIIIMTFWKNLGFYILIYLAGLQNINRELYEAADMEGIGWWGKHYYVTLPLVAPTSLFVFVVSIILTFRVFDQIHLMTEGGPANNSNVIVYYIYEQGFKFFDLGMAASLTVILVFILLVLVIIVFGIFGRKITYTAD